MNTIIKNFAGIFLRWKPACFIMLAALLLVSCKEDPIGQQPTDGRRPNPIFNVEAIGRPGGAYIFYKLPEGDTDISYVKGEFEINGEKQTVRSSVYNNYLAIEGLDSHLYVEIDLYVVDHSENVSEPERVRFITLDAPYTTMGNSIILTAAVGGVAARWESPNSMYQYMAQMGYIPSNYDSDVGVVILVGDSKSKVSELTVSFSAACSVLQPLPDDSAYRWYGAYAMDKWGHYSDTVWAWLKPMKEQWLNRRLMKEHYVGNDNRTILEPNIAAAYYSAMPRLFDSLTYCLQPYTNAIASTNIYETAHTDTVTKPYCFTMDLGVTADISRFWIGLPTHSDNDRFYEFSYGSVYDFELWGTTTDFANENSMDYVPADDPYWTNGYWKEDTRWRYMGRYYNRRPSNPGDTPGNYTTEPPNRNKDVDLAASDRRNWDADWTADHDVRANGNGVRYLADGSGPVRNNNFYFPNASVHFTITQAGAGPVRYVRWVVNEVWQQENYLRISELWYWGGVSEDNN